MINVMQAIPHFDIMIVGTLMVMMGSIIYKGTVK